MFLYFWSKIFSDCYFSRTWALESPLSRFHGQLLSATSAARKAERRRFRFHQVPTQETSYQTGNMYQTWLMNKGFMHITATKMLDLSIFVQVWNLKFEIFWKKFYICFFGRFTTWSFVGPVTFSKSLTLQWPTHKQPETAGMWSGKKWGTCVCSAGETCLRLDQMNLFAIVLTVAGSISNPARQKSTNSVFLGVIWSCYWHEDRYFQKGFFLSHWYLRYGDVWCKLVSAHYFQAFQGTFFSQRQLPFA